LILDHRRLCLIQVRIASQFFGQLSIKDVAVVGFQFLKLFTVEQQQLLRLFDLSGISKRRRPDVLFVGELNRTERRRLVIAFLCNGLFVIRESNFDTTCQRVSRFTEHVLVFNLDVCQGTFGTGFPRIDFDLDDEVTLLPGVELCEWDVDVLSTDIGFGV